MVNEVKGVTVAMKVADAPSAPTIRQPLLTTMFATLV